MPWKQFIQIRVTETNEIPIESLVTPMIQHLNANFFDYSASKSQRRTNVSQRRQISNKSILIDF